MVVVMRDGLALVWLVEVGCDDDGPVGVGVHILRQD
jgi:hypothetical protein